MSRSPHVSGAFSVSNRVPLHFLGLLLPAVPAFSGCHGSSSVIMRGWILRIRLLSLKCLFTTQSDPHTLGVFISTVEGRLMIRVLLWLGLRFPVLQYRSPGQNQFVPVKLSGEYSRTIFPGNAWRDFSPSASLSLRYR